MKWALIVGILTLLSSVASWAQESAVRDILTDPNLSLRCKDLLKERNDKIIVRQRLSGLLQRNQNLLKETPEMKVAMRQRLQASQTTIRNELYLTTLQVQSMEESIIRSGCPGINL